MSLYSLRARVKPRALIDSHLLWIGLREGHVTHTDQDRGSLPWAYKAHSNLNPRWALIHLTAAILADTGEAGTSRIESMSYYNMSWGLRQTRRHRGNTHWTVGYATITLRGTLGPWCVICALPQWLRTLAAQARKHSMPSIFNSLIMESRNCSPMAANPQKVSIRRLSSPLHKKKAVIGGHWSLLAWERGENLQLNKYAHTHVEHIVLD